MMPVRFEGGAREELAAAATYYNEQQPGLGFRFVSAVEGTISRVQRAPYLHRALEDDLRKIRVRKFPYAVIYRTREQQIEVIAVMHLRRRPGYWRERTR
jgi:plasmid stabilization system protein ParE